MTITEKIVASDFNNSISICNAAIENFHKICRFCLSSDHIKPFCDITYNQASVEMIIFDCLSLKVDPEDPLPRNLCETCITQLIRCHKFRENCIRVTNTLRDAYYNRNSRINKEINIQCNTSEYCDVKTDTLVIKQEEIDNSSVRNDYILEDMCSDNFDIKKEPIEDIQSVYDGNGSGDMNSGDLVIQNVEIEDASLTYSNDNLIIKIEEMEDTAIISTDTDNSPGTDEEVYGVSIVCDDIVLEDSDNLTNENILHKCRFCERSFSRKCAFKKHMLIHQGEKLYKCRLCEKSYVSKSYLMRHMFKHSDDSTHKCSICTKSFVHKSSLDSHMLIHNGEIPHKCNLCDKSFGTKSNLENHMRIHLSEKPYKCSICMMSFNENPSLKRHMSIHTGERPYECRVCFECFIDESDINKHMKTHLDEILYKCNVCGKSFFYKSFLKTHMETHKAE